MESITPMISPILVDAAVISSMVLTAPATTSPPRVAVTLAELARRVACAAASADCLTLTVSSDSEAEVSSMALAEPSVRLDRSWLPALISSVAVVIDSTPWRTSFSTALIFSTKLLNDAAICATSSRPWTGRRCVRSPLPEPTSSIASRTCDRRRKDCAVSSAVMPAAASTSSTMAMAEVRTTLARPAVASALSSATTSSQSVPCTGIARSSLGAPLRSASSEWLAPCREDTTAGVSAAETSDTGLSMRFASGWASTRPSLSITKPRLLGVGCTAATTSSTPLSGTAPLIAPCAVPPRRMGAANETNGSPVEASP